MIRELIYLGHSVFLLYRLTVNRNLKEKFLLYTDTTLGCGSNLVSYLHRQHYRNQISHVDA